MSSKEQDEDETTSKSDPDSKQEEENTDEGEEKQEEKDKPRSKAEWVTLAFSILIVLALVGLVTYQFLTQGDNPPTISVEPQTSEIRQEGELYYLPITITNSGDSAVEDVEIELSLEAESEPETIGFTVKFLAGGESDYETAVFNQNPSKGTLTYNISFRTP